MQEVAGDPMKRGRGQPAKPVMTDEEFQAIVPILVKPTRKHGGSLEHAAMTISRMRGSETAITPKVASKRRVSPRWVQRQLRLRGIPGKKGIQAKFGPGKGNGIAGQNSKVTGYSGSRLPPEPSSDGQKPSENQSPFVNGPEDPTDRPPGNEVESEPKAATQ